MATQSYLLFGDDEPKAIYVGDVLNITLVGGKIVTVTATDGFLFRTDDRPEPFSPMRLGFLKAIQNRSRGWAQRL